MFFAKAVSILLAGVLAIAAVRQLLAARQQAKARVRPQSNPNRVTRLRQDPRTGIYFPET
jgi:uncharacterized membrane protein